MKSVALTALIFLLVSARAYPQQNDAAAVVRTVLEKQKNRPFWFHLRSITFGYVPYVFDVKSRVVKYDDHGNPKQLGLGCAPEAGAVGVFVPVEDTLLYTPLSFCGRPVDAKTTESWQQKREKKLADAKRRSEGEKAEIRAKQEEQRKERALFWDEFLKAFHFKIDGRRVLNDRPTTIVAFTPDPTYRPGKAIDTKYLPKLRGGLWVDDADNEIVHFEMEFTDNVTAGFGLLGKVSAGTSYFMDLKKPIDDRWMPVKAETRIKMRALLMMKTDEMYTVEYSNYRKFSANVRLLDTDPH